jgi:trimeric autotransporter adhesin
LPNVSDGNGVGVKDFMPDDSLGLSFYLTHSTNQYSPDADSITAFNVQTFMPATVLPLPFDSIEGSNGFTGVDLVRWGQDGLAVLSSSGNVYLIRGAAVVPQLLNNNTAAVITASSLSSATHGSGNIILTLTGSNFVPGVAVLWNGNYRTTTIVDATHLTVAIPAADFSQAGTANITAVILVLQLLHPLLSPFIRSY